MRITMVMLLRHTGHVSITTTRFAQLSQKRACPQSTSANPSRGATKHTSPVVSAAASAAVCGAVDVVVGVAAVISVVVTVDVRRLQRRRVSAHRMINGTQELESRIRPVIKLGQTGLDSRLVYDVSLVVRGHSRSTAMSPFDRAHTTSYSTLIETMCLSFTVFEI